MDRTLLAGLLVVVLGCGGRGDTNIRHGGTDATAPSAENGADAEQSVEPAEPVDGEQPDDAAKLLAQLRRLSPSGPKETREVFLNRARAEIARNPEATAKREILAWKLAYDFAASATEPDEEYALIREALMCLLEGLDHIPDEPTLHWAIGRIVERRLGDSTSAARRRRFLEDEALHAEIDRRIPLPDDAVRDRLVAPIAFARGRPAYLARPPEQGMSAIVFCASEARALEWRAVGLLRDGRSDEVVVAAWERAEQAWEDLGDIEIDGIRTGDENEFLRIANGPKGAEQERAEATLAIIEARRELVDPVGAGKRIRIERTPEALAIRRDLYAILEAHGIDDLRRLDRDATPNAQSDLRDVLARWDAVMPEEIGGGAFEEVRDLLRERP